VLFLFPGVLYESQSVTINCDKTGESWQLIHPSPSAPIINRLLELISPRAVELIRICRIFFTHWLKVDTLPHTIFDWPVVCTMGLLECLFDFLTAVVRDKSYNRMEVKAWVEYNCRW